MSEEETAFEHAVRYVPPRELVVYGVTDTDLDRLAEGGPSSVFLAFSLPLLSSAFSFLVVIVTITLTDRLFATFLTATLVFGIAGLVLLAIWWRTRTSASALVSEIRNRPVPDVGEQLSQGDPDAPVSR